MMSVDRLKLAAVLDRMADYVENVESDKTASVRAERSASIDKLATRYVEATGEELPDSVRKKLADTDKDIVELIQSMAEKNASIPEELGGPSSRRDEPSPMNIKEAADAAYDRFGAWLTS